MKRFVRVVGAVVAGVVAMAVPALAQQCCTGNVSTYCTAGTSVQGCLPQISGVGIPSADAGAGFQVGVSGLPGQRYGTLFYGFYSFVTPWAPGSPSFKCVASPVQRTGTLSTGATAASCAGTLSLDFNAWITANPSALGAPFLPGQTIRAQAWYRDPSAPGQTNLSDALQFTLCSGVGDTTPPVITTCAANQTVGTSAGCQGVVPDFTVGMAATDNCTAVVFSQSPAFGSSAPLGANVVTITARDAAGNTSQCVATLTVADTTAPVITSCAANQTVAANSNCQGVVPDFTTGVIASDSCGGAVTLSQSPAAGTTTSSGLSSTAVTITATDLTGNTATCTATLTVTLSGACQIPSGFVAIQPGTFQMGSNAANAAPYYNANGVSTQPLHMVSISYLLWMGAKEVTQEQYTLLMGNNPSHFSGNPNYPVERVTWFNARAYCAALNAQQAAMGSVPVGYEYRLPTEAEWEYACRAGTTTEFNTGPNLFCPDARFYYSYHSQSYCGSGSPTSVGSYPPNAWGLYDMHGNVWEWCLDSLAAYSGSAVTDPFVTGGANRVLRGGGWDYFSSDCRAAVRFGELPNGVNDGVGFRVVLGPILVP